jgi:hypothetical protein
MMLRSCRKAGQGLRKICKIPIRAYRLVSDRETLVTPMTVISADCIVRKTATVKDLQNLSLTNRDIFALDLFADEKIVQGVSYSSHSFCVTKEKCVALSIGQLKGTDFNKPFIYNITTHFYLFIYSSIHPYIHSSIHTIIQIRNRYYFTR